MRLAQVGLGFGVGLPGFSYARYDPGQVRVQIFPEPEKPDNYRYLNPPERSFETVMKKNPSATTNKGRIVS